MSIGLKRWPLHKIVEKKSTSYCWCRVSSQSCSLSCGEALDDGLTESFVLRSSFVILSALQRHGGDELLHFVGQSLFLCRLVLFQCNSDLPKEHRKVLITLALRWHERSECSRALWNKLQRNEGWKNRKVYKTEGECGHKTECSISYILYIYFTLSKQRDRLSTLANWQCGQSKIRFEKQIRIGFNVNKASVRIHPLLEH